jgi:2-isopropylmalate synthase
VPKTTLVLGKHSGRHAVQKRCEELGFVLTKFELDRVYRQMTALADRQKAVSDAELVTLVEAVKQAESQTAPGASQVEVGYGHGV